MVTIAQQPADDNHPYGHHKAEYFSAGFEGFLIVGVSIGIAWAALHRLYDPQPLEQIGWGVVLSTVSSAFNGALAWVMFRSAREHRSLALEADARHLITDVWTSAGVIVGLIGAAITGLLWLDVVAALVVAVNILREGVALIWQSSQGLMDQAAEPEVQERIAQELNRFTQSHPDGVLRFDHLVTRRAGQRHFANLHLHVPSHWTLGNAAHLRGDAERALMAAVPGLRVSIELLPNDMEAHLDDHPADQTSTQQPLK
jgi:cation diffusion facilitator family transporter